MKRAALVDYASFDEDESHVKKSPEPVAKKRKLPALAGNLVIPVPVDNPALHQGRIRSSPHVEGQFASYVYVPLKIPRGSALYTLLENVFRCAKSLVPTLHPIGGNEGPNTKERELHVSLTRPVYLRAHQRDEFRTAVRTVCRQHAVFSTSFTNFAELTNDERSRTFLTVEIGAGHRELEALCAALAPTLRSYRQKEFYDQPRFHASVAWALLSSTSSTSSIPLNGAVDNKGNKSPGTNAGSPKPASTLDTAIPSGTFATIPRFPDDLVPTLEQEFAATLRSRHVGMFEAEYLCVKMGKDVHRWKLQGGP